MVGDSLYLDFFEFCFRFVINRIEIQSFVKDLCREMARNIEF